MKKIPCHLIAGPLGVGKTTTVLNYLKKNAAREFIAVLTNDFGVVGLDSAILSSEVGGEQVKLVNVPGGCICCTSFQSFELGLEQIAALPHVDRVIIEPSGLTMLNQLCPALEKLCARLGFEWHPVIVLIDPGRVKKAQIENLPYFEHLIHHADILVANRCDRNKPEALAHFMEWAGAWNPPKLKIITTTYGQLPEELFELTKNGVTEARHTSHRHPHHDHPVSGGREWDADTVFLTELLIAALRTKGIQRFKGIFNTDHGWQLIEWASGEIHRRPAAPADSSRAEWILDRSSDTGIFPDPVQGAILHGEAKTTAS